MNTPSRRLVQTAALLTPLLSACSIQIGGFRTAEPGMHMSEHVDPFEMAKKGTETRDALIRCVLNAPEDHGQFEHSVETRLGGTYEKGSFTYDDEKGRQTKVDVSVTTFEGGMSRSQEKKAKVWGVDGQEQALKACKKVY